MTAEEAHAVAEEEGLTLVRAENPVGFKGVSRSSGATMKPFKAQLWRGGHNEHLGVFATAEEAALAVARSLGSVDGAPPAPPVPEPAPMTAEEAHAAAAAEGLTLLRQESARYSNATGFKGVCRNGNSPSKPFRANLKRDGREKHLGCFATAEEAALAVARFLGPQGVVASLAAAATAALEPAMTAAEAHAAAESEGLALLRAENTTGFKGVFFTNNATKPFKAELTRGGRKNNLGTFATAEAAALAVARFLGPEGVAAQPSNSQ